MYDKKTFYLVMDCLFLTFFLFYFINIIGALSLIQYCLKPDPNTRATTKDILRHDWLAHGPVLSIRLNSTTSSNESDKNRLQPNSLSPTNSLVELELHTSSFFDSTRLGMIHKECPEGSTKSGRMCPQMRRFTRRHFRMTPYVITHQ
jgi:serine/threonine protein kinase